MKFSDEQEKEINDFVLKYNSDLKYSIEIQELYDYQIEKLSILQIYALEEILLYGNKKIFNSFLKAKGDIPLDKGVKELTGYSRLLSSNIDFRKIKAEQLKNNPRSLSSIEMFGFKLICESDTDEIQKEDRNNYSDVNDFFYTIKQKRNEITDLKNSLDIPFKDRIHIFLSPASNKRDLKIFRTKSIMKIKSNREYIESREKYLEHLSTINFDIAMNFIARAISIIESEYYQAKNFLFLNTTWLAVASVPIPIANSDSLCLIASSNVINEISKLYNNNQINSSDDIDKNIIGNQHMITPNLDDKCRLLDIVSTENSMNLCANFPYLQDIIRDLISFRLANPNLSETQATENMLTLIPDKYQHLINKNVNKSNR